MRILTLVPQFLLGLSIGSLLSGIWFYPDRTQQIVETLQTLSLFIATVFTAYWTSKTFAHQAQTNEAKELMARVDSLIAAISDLAYVSIYEKINRTMGTDTAKDPGNYNDQQILRMRAAFRAANETFHDLVSTTMYLSPSVKFGLLMSAIQMKTEDDLIASSDDRQKMIKDLLQLKSTISVAAYFNLTAEFRRLRNYLRI